MTEDTDEVIDMGYLSLPAEVQQAIEARAAGAGWFLTQPQYDELIRRVQARVADQLGDKAVEMRRDYITGPYKHSIEYINGWEDAAGWLEDLADGSPIRDAAGLPEETP